MTQKVAKKRLLIVDDDEAILSFFQEIFPRKQYAVDCVSDGERALGLAAEGDYDVIVTDLCMPKMDGLKLINEIHQLDPHAIVVAITGFGTIKDAVSLMKTGAYDVLTKPFSLDEIRTTIDKAIRHSRLAKEKRELEHRVKISERLTDVGTEAASLATEIRHTVEAVGQLVQEAIDATGPDADSKLASAQEQLEALDDSIGRLAAFTDNLKAEAEHTMDEGAPDEATAAVSAPA